MSSFYLVKGVGNLPVLLNIDVVFAYFLEGIHSLVDGDGYFVQFHQSGNAIVSLQIFGVENNCIKERGEEERPLESLMEGGRGRL